MSKDKPMNNNFDTFVKEHLEGIICEAEKDHALDFIRKAHLSQHERTHLNMQRQSVGPEIQLKDCVVSSSFSHSRL
jgi:hypothetical protein